MDDNTLKAIERLCDLAKETSTTSGEMAVINILSNLMAKVQPNQPSASGVQFIDLPSGGQS